MEAVESDIVTPDSRLQVKFYKKAIKSEYQSQIQERPIYEDRDCVRIMIPGDDKTVVDTLVNETHKRRFPLHWAHYLNTQGKEEKIIGTPLEDWGRLTPSQVEELKAFKFNTVDSIASASDLQLQKIGMIVGVSPYVLRDQAKKYVHVNPLTVDEAAPDRIAQLQAENERLQKEMEDKLATMQAQLQAVLAKNEMPNSEVIVTQIRDESLDVKKPEVKTSAKRRGRPSKKV